MRPRQTPMCACSHVLGTPKMEATVIDRLSCHPGPVPQSFMALCAPEPFVPTCHDIRKIFPRAKRSGREEGIGSSSCLRIALGPRIGRFLRRYPMRCPSRPRPAARRVRKTRSVTMLDDMASSRSSPWLEDISPSKCVTLTIRRDPKAVRAARRIPRLPQTHDVAFRPASLTD